MNRDVNPEVSPEKFQKALKTLLSRKDCARRVPLEKLRDFHLLLFLAEFMKEDMHSICRQVRRDLEESRSALAAGGVAEAKMLGDGHTMMLKAYAGIDM